ncbi:uncharacterized protein LOC130719765 [Lotus japonicus]|uniref:uncharacterized protein LOC130719765 n=1 Tax=Lotus japonicus TaxID=34305 RepID=UPI002589E18E|nr:uncharacterized protein LOC130719765 [Lotus japonicus]
MGDKVNLEYIAHEDSRRAASLRRIKGLRKKFEELIVPSGGIEERTVLSELERSKKMLNLESLLDEMILKASEKLAKMQRMNREIEMFLRMFEFLANENIIETMSTNELNQIASTIDEKFKQVDQMIIELNNNASTSQSQAQVADPTLVAANGAIMQGEEQVQMADPTLVVDGEIMQGEAQAQVADGASMEAEAQVNHGQSDEMNKKATQVFTSFLKHINGGDDDSST